jgi:hypothetical protein
VHESERRKREKAEESTRVIYIATGISDMASRERIRGDVVEGREMVRFENWILAFSWARARGERGGHGTRKWAAVVEWEGEVARGT